MQKDILRKQPSSERKLRNTSADYRHSSFCHGDSLWSFISKVGSGSERRIMEMEQVIMMVIMIEMIIAVMIVMIVGNND